MRNRSANGVESGPSRAHSTTKLTRFTPKTSWVDVGALRTNPRNARTHSKKQIRQIAKSVKQFGFLNSILVDETRMVLAGNGRLEPPWKNLLVDRPNSRSSDWSVP
jgi:ParB-like nuclease domain